MSPISVEKHNKQFIWQGVDRNRISSAGELTAKDVNQARILLRQRGVRVTRLKAKRKPLFVRKKPIKPTDISIVSRQMATMIAAGLQISQTLQIIAKGQDKNALHELTSSLYQEVEAGNSLSESLANYPQYFDSLYISLVQAGEESGKLDIMLQQIASHNEKMLLIRRKLKSALTYPIIVLIISILVVGVLLLFVIPQFETLFSSYGAELPALTQLMVDGSHWFKLQWDKVIIITFTAALLLRQIIKRSAKLQLLTDRISLKLPIFGKLIKKSIYARFSRTLSIIFGAGVPLSSGMALVSAATNNHIYRIAIDKVNQSIHAGNGIANSMATSDLFPNMMLQMIDSGEQSGNLETMLEKVAEFYESEVDETLSTLSSLLEPLMIVVLGTIIATVVLAMYLPIFKMASVF